MKYKCDACGNCICYSEPKEDWGLPEKDMCLYEVGFPVNWRKVRKTVRAKRPVQQRKADKPLCGNYNQCTIPSIGGDCGGEGSKNVGQCSCYKNPAARSAVA